MEKLLLALSLAVQMAFAFAVGPPVTTNIGTQVSHGGNPTTTATIASVTVPAGALIVVVSVDRSNLTAAAGATCSDGTNGSYTAGLVKKYQQDSGFNTSMTFFYFANSAALSGATITCVSQDAGGPNPIISAFYATNILTTSPLDTAVTATVGINNSAANPPFTLTSGTPSVTGELIVAFVGWQSGTTDLTLDTGDGWSAIPTNIADASSSTAILGGHQVNSGTGTVVFKPVNSGTSIFGRAFIIGFKAIPNPSSFILSPTVIP